MGGEAKNLPKSNGELRELPYAQVLCPGDAFNIRRPFHPNRTSRQTSSELINLRCQSEKWGPNPEGLANQAKASSLIE